MALEQSAATRSLGHQCRSVAVSGKCKLVFQDEPLHTVVYVAIGNYRLESSTMAKYEEDEHSVGGFFLSSETYHRYYRSCFPTEVGSACECFLELRLQSGRYPLGWCWCQWCAAR